MNTSWSITRITVATAVGATVLAALTVGCGTTTATKAGKRNGPLVLRMASRDSDPTFDLGAAYFVNRVGQVSGGALRVEVVPGWGNEKPDVEQQIVRAVTAGKVDLGAVGTRVFDTFGVSSFQALTAPMLIDSYALERAVFASQFPEQMLHGLARLNVTGLAVLARRR
jgi:TRAP-type C4-dicarboxylate transport system substrate-binding protein